MREPSVRHSAIAILRIQAVHAGTLGFFSAAPENRAQRIAAGIHQLAAIASESATPELAARDFGSISIQLPSHEMCEITGERAVAAAGFEPVVPWITAVRITPEGHLYVQRRDPTDLPTRRIDVFDPAGTYLGTLPGGFPLPARFRTSDTFFRVELDELNVPTVAIRRIVRDGG